MIAGRNLEAADVLNYGGLEAGMKRTNPFINHCSSSVCMPQLKLYRRILGSVRTVITPLLTGLIGAFS